MKNIFAWARGDQSPQDLRISLKDILAALSTALDVVDNQLTNHHRVVAYIVIRLMEIMGEPKSAIDQCAMAALVHDIGLVRNFHQKKSPISNRELDLDHPVVGAKYISQVTALRHISDLILYHHFNAVNLRTLRAKGVAVPAHADVFCAADSMALFLDGAGGVGAPGIQQNLLHFIQKGRGIEIDDRIVKAAEVLLSGDSFWLDLATNRIDRLLKGIGGESHIMSGSEAAQIAELFAMVIDGRSQFTANHSFGVAFLAGDLAAAYGWSAIDALKLTIAGHLHDTGKLAIPNEIIEKPAKLDDDEWRVMRSHVFHTRRILEVVDGLGDMVDWAADHHERLDGSGYPFRKRGDEISLGSRILTIADILTALTEDRPYRAHMPREKVLGILQKQVESGKLDAKVYECAADNFDRLNQKRAAAQSAHDERSRLFWSEVDVSLGQLATQFT